MPTPEVAAAVRDHHVHQVFSAYIGSGSFSILYLSMTRSRSLTLKARLRGARVIMPFGGWSLKILFK